MTEKTLDSGIAVKIKMLGEDQIATLKDIMEFVQYPDGSSTVKNVNKHRLAWIRAGVIGLKDWHVENGEHVPDELLKTLTEIEKDELFTLIQESQVLNPTTPSHLV
jgi:hypothetical protein